MMMITIILMMMMMTQESINDFYNLLSFLDLLSSFIWADFHANIDFGKDYPVTKM